MMQKVAIIDLGTNSCKLSIVTLQNKQINYIIKTKEPVMFGAEGTLPKGILSIQSQQRTYKAFEKFSAEIKKQNCNKIIAVATSALRSAKNANELIKKINTDFGIKIKIISGNDEALLIYQGVKNSITFTNDNFLILDIGGGSSEFIIANKDKVIWQHSFNLGAARLLDANPLSDPAKLSETETLKAYLTKELNLLKQVLEKHPVTTLIGSSGVFNNFMKMVYHQNNIPITENKTYNYIDIELFKKLKNYLERSTREQRLKIIGLEPMRVDLIVIATLFIYFVIDMANIKQLIQSAYDLKEGIIFTEA